MLVKIDRGGLVVFSREVRNYMWKSTKSKRVGLRCGDNIYSYLHILKQIGLQKFNDMCVNGFVEYYDIEISKRGDGYIYSSKCRLRLVFVPNFTINNFRRGLIEKVLNINL